MNQFSEIWVSLPLWGWGLAAVAAFLVGFSKTGIGNVALLAVAAMAATLPAKESTGAVLVMYLVADLVAIWVYRQHVEWKMIASLILPVLVGLAIGAVFLAWVSDLALKRTIGVIVLILLVMGLRPDKLKAERRIVRYGYGSLSGFTTMVANSGGPAFSLYLLASRFDKMRFLGTSAWFFFAVNATKLPISITLGIIRPSNALFALIFTPIILAGTWLGVWLVKRLNQKLFDGLVMAFVAVAGLYLLLG
ncbi:MAG: sulfite exporter TauE/SafE family protein [Bifidobacteriaceae bacterium]|nr:sulfite exporter TauE/SafE family protein [Bifidobacteriaceae bacterium]